MRLSFMNDDVRNVSLQRQRVSAHRAGTDTSRRPPEPLKHTGQAATCAGQYCPARDELSHLCSTIHPMKTPTSIYWSTLKKCPKLDGFLDIHSNSIFYGSLNKHAVNTTKVPHRVLHDAENTHTRTHTSSEGEGKKQRTAIEDPGLKKFQNEHFYCS